MAGIVYLIVNSLHAAQGKDPYLYIGSKRDKEKFATYMGSSKALTADIAVLGKEHFEKIVLADNVDEAELLETERRFQKLFSAATNPAFYNRVYACGEFTSPNAGYRWINRGARRKVVPEAEITRYLGRGWQEGFGEGSCSDKVWMFRGEERGRVAHTDVPIRMGDGWQMGRGGFTANQKRVYMTRGQETISVTPDAVEQRLAEGWTKGRKGREGHTWVNNGSENKVIPLTQLDEFTSSGWFRGMVKP